MTTKEEIIEILDRIDNMNIKLIIGLLLITAVIILSGCVDSAPAQQLAPEISQTVHLIKSEKIFNASYPNYKVIHDDELNQTCTIFLYDRGAGFHCSADSK